MKRLFHLVLAALAALSIVQSTPAAAAIKQMPLGPIKFRNPLWNPGTACCSADTATLVLGGGFKSDVDTTQTFALPGIICPPWASAGVADTSASILTIIVSSDTTNGVTGTAFGCVLEAVPSSVTGSSSSVITASPYAIVVDSVGAVFNSSVPTGAERSSVQFVFKNFFSPSVAKLARNAFGPTAHTAFMSSRAYRLRLVGASTSYVQRARVSGHYWADDK